MTTALVPAAKLRSTDTAAPLAVQELPTPWERKVYDSNDSFNVELDPIVGDLRLKLGSPADGGQITAFAIDPAASMAYLGTADSFEKSLVQQWQRRGDTDRSRTATSQLNRDRR